MPPRGMPPRGMPLDDVRVPPRADDPRRAVAGVFAPGDSENGHECSRRGNRQPLRRDPHPDIAAQIVLLAAVGYVEEVRSHSRHPTAHAHEQPDVVEIVRVHEARVVLARGHPAQHPPDKVQGRGSLPRPVHRHRGIPHNAFASVRPHNALRRDGVSRLRLRRAHQRDSGREERVLHIEPVIEDRAYDPRPQQHARGILKLFRLAHRHRSGRRHCEHGATLIGNQRGNVQCRPRPAALRDRERINLAGVVLRFVARLHKPRVLRGGREVLGAIVQSHVEKQAVVASSLSG